MVGLTHAEDAADEDAEDVFFTPPSSQNTSTADNGIVNGELEKGWVRYFKILFYQLSVFFGGGVTISLKKTRNWNKVKENSEKLRKYMIPKILR